MYTKMRIRTALIGVDSFSAEGLKSAGKLWNPVGQKMAAAIEKIQASGIMVLSSIICGLESNTLETIRTMRKFANESGTLFAQFTVHNPYPGTKDFYEMMDDKKNMGKVVGHFDGAAQIRLGHEVAKMDITDLHDPQPIQTLWQVCDRNIVFLHPVP